MSLSIKVDGLSKRYWLRHNSRYRYQSLREEIVQLATSPFRALARAVTRKPAETGATLQTFWALKDVSFELEQGDVVGIIGRNGAGKSTLLKILSRITEPTEGRVEIEGRVASLLEVGTGFHPELTGRENIFLNGAILGMTRAEIRKKFDEIVAFAEVENFLDSPVKRYSSGMYVRLAFAVAAHLEPEILVVDEVLAVGDAQFQKKCLGKMEDVSKQQGRTILFVSHNTGMIAQLCKKAILLDHGRIAMTGGTDAVVSHYIDQVNDSSALVQKEASATGNQFTAAYMSDAADGQRSDYKFDEEVVISINVLLNDYTNDLELAMRLIDRYKNPVFTIHEKLEKHKGTDKSIRLKIVIPPVFIAPGRYSWVMGINKPGTEIFDLQNDVLPFGVLESGSEFSRYEGLNYGSVFPRYSVQKSKS